VICFPNFNVTSTYILVDGYSKNLSHSEWRCTEFLVLYIHTADFLCCVAGLLCELWDGSRDAQTAVMNVQSVVPGVEILHNWSQGAVKIINISNLL
jgi:hypothetical protein